MKLLNEWSLEAPWGKIALISWGNPKGKPVLLVHGRQDSSATFVPLMELLPEHYYYVGIDLPGHGKSDAFPIGTSLTRFLFVVPIDMVIRNLGWKEFYYIGHSMGAELGLFYSAIYPKQVKKLVLLDPSPGLCRLVIEDFPHFYSYYDKYYSNYNKYNVDNRVYSKKAAVQSVVRNRGLTEGQAEVILSRNLNKIGEDCYKLSWDRRTKNLIPTNYPLDYYYKLFSKLTSPVLYVNANKRPSNFYASGTKTVEKLVEKLENNNKLFTFVEVDGSHDVHFIHPERFSDVLCDFLNTSDVTSKL